jgi:hypothetical protein
MITSKKIIWTEKVASMGEMRNTCISIIKPSRKGSLGRSRHRWDGSGCADVDQIQLV